MSLLSENDRGYILKELLTAPDEILADAMLALNAARDKIVAVRKLTATQEAFAEDVTAGEAEPVAKNAERKNVSPGPSSITKIGSETKAMLLLDVGCNKQPPAKYAEHLKLLWSRGEVKFDGKEWYI